MVKIGPKTVDCVFIRYVVKNKVCWFLVHKSENPEIHVNMIIDLDNTEFFEHIYPYKTEYESTSERPKRPREESTENTLPNEDPRRNRQRKSTSFGPDFVAFLLENEPPTFKAIISLSDIAVTLSSRLEIPRYREPGVLLWRGFTLEEFTSQLLGNKGDSGKGRQMPIHYGSNKLNYFTVSSPIATQLPQAVGAAYALKMDKKEACVVTYFGDGTTSEGDFHAALNFAAVLEAPIIFLCRNNGWAISTPVAEQFRSDGVAIKGQAYGVRSTRVDGNDALAVYSAIRAAREMAIKEQRPIIVEAMAYRVSDHSSSDDSTKYRSREEIEYWRRRCSVARFRKWIQKNGWWSDEEELEFRGNTKGQVLQALERAEETEKPPLTDLFTDVYDQIPLHLQEQERYIRDAINKRPNEYPTNIPI
ncbi:2-oxoisovalerate dehydrogenase subunit alpha 1, mitochondrial-like [Solanum stenotomum]|uniref:2-oxoisovalerate dehydrogenase subunit alpha 1, mitochondrial-like n=1 Tax=Solanum stenotomum TaxID=172797 RepID=UPI0020D095B4|nr:2-oxoisovalerate dehydrogenase subunit alpha 1, mitochondrial-like [Solanum stenotomum]